MTNGQIQQLQDLNKCYMRRWDRIFIDTLLLDRNAASFQLRAPLKKNLRRLTHQYRNQIAAIKRNQERA
jgi:hypothetical protein